MADDLPAAARRVRERIIDMVFRSGSGHVGAALSQTDVLVALYHRALRSRPRPRASSGPRATAR